MSAALAPDEAPRLALGFAIRNAIGVAIPLLVGLAIILLLLALLPETPRRPAASRG